MSRTHAVSLSAIASLAAIFAGCAEPLPAGQVTVQALPAHATGAWVGVSEAPDGERFAYHTTGGLYRLDDDGAVLLANPADILADAESLPTSDFHDIAAMGGGRFAIVADNDGFLYDHNFGLLTRHFCYLPGETIDDPAGWGPDPVPTEEGMLQRTLSLDYDPVMDRIVAQPRTYDEVTGQTQAAHVASFDGATGLDQEWYQIGDRELLAGGLIELGRTVILGRGTELVAFDRNDRTLAAVLDLGDLVDDISGLSRSGRAGTVLVTDEGRDQLLEVTLPEW